MADGCPTCRAIEALLVGSRRVPPPVAKAIAKSAPARRLDKTLRGARKVKAVRKASSYSRKLAKHLKAERAKATKKNGQLKKGMTQAIIMKKAHKCVKREMRKK